MVFLAHENFHSSSRSSRPRVSDPAICHVLIATAKVIGKSKQNASRYAMATRKLLEQSAPAGLYHCVNSGRCTWLEFAQEAARQMRVEPRLVPVRMADMKFRADRPLYCALSNDKLAAAGFVMPTWQDAIARYIRVA